MNNMFVTIINFLYRIRWWLILGTASVTALVYYMTEDMRKIYEVNTTVYTGIVSGFDIQTGDNTTVTQTGVNNAMDNLLNILVSKATLNKVALRLFAQHMMYGNPNEDNKYMTANSFRYLYAAVPQDVKDLIDKSSEANTLKNLYEYQDRSYDNYVYGLFNWTHPFYSYEVLKTIMVKKVGSSDMIDISYQSSDPGIAYNTLLILTEEFANQYADLRYGETDSVIKYFEEELARARQALKLSEDSLTFYSTEKRVINYEEQSKHVAALSRDFELTYEEILLRYEGTKKQIEMLEGRIGEYAKRARSSAEFLETSQKITDLTTRITQAEIFKDKTVEDVAKIRIMKEQLEKEEKKFKNFSQAFAEAQYTAEGISNLSFIEQWLQATIDHEKAKAELAVMEERKKELDNKYTFFSPVGTTLKRMEREVTFNESIYHNILHNLNQARLRKKNLQLTGASLQVINPPIFPLISKPTKRMYIVIGACAGSFLFILGIFMLIELLDRTLRDKRRAENVTGVKVIGALPAPNKFRFRAYNRKCEEIADKYLANVLMNFEKVNGRLIINICGITEDGEKEKLAQRLYAEWMQAELNVRMAVCGEDFFMESKEYMFADSIENIVDVEDYDIIVVVLPALNKAPVPQNLISCASVNVLLADAKAVWREADQLLVENLVTRSEKTPVKLCLGMCDRTAVETFTGLLPPYTRMRRFVYKILQLGITSK